MKYGGIEFEDVRIDREKWPEIKESEYEGSGEGEKFIFWTFG